MKSINSKHEATIDEIKEQIEIVIANGFPSKSTVWGLTKIQEFKMESLTYLITSINDYIVAFELENVYCFKF